MPIWNALPTSERGRFYAVDAAIPRAQELGLRTSSGLPFDSAPVLTAGFVDYRKVKGRAVFVNHGVGQAWRHPNGTLIPTGVGAAKPGVLLFLTPGPHATAATLEANPGANVIEVGSPKLDRWLGHKPTEPLCVVSTHWDLRACIESRSALPHYLDALKSIRMPLALHAHPRINAWARERAKLLGIEFIPTFDEVLARASVYATDCSSTLFEFAATGRPVVVINGPHYRREHHHGLRFWEASTVGVNADSPDELAGAVERAAADTPPQAQARQAALRLAYAPLDGQATQRAVTAILEAHGETRVPGLPPATAAA